MLGMVAWKGLLMPAPARIDQQALLAAMFGMLDEQGLSGLSLRAVAARLGVKAASLYGHVSGKAELLTMVSDAVCRSALAGLSADAGWRACARDLAAGLRRELATHPGAAAVVASCPVSAELYRELGPLVAALAGQMRRGPSETAWALQSIYLFTAAHALAEHGDPPAAPSAPREYYDSWFEFAIGTFLDGLEANTGPGARGSGAPPRASHPRDPQPDAMDMEEGST